MIFLALIVCIHMKIFIEYFIIITLSASKINEWEHITLKLNKHY